MLYDFDIIIYYSISLLTSFCCRSNRISIKWWWCIAYLLYYNMQWTLVYWLWTCLSRSNRLKFLFLMEWFWSAVLSLFCIKYPPNQIHNYEKNKFSLINKAHILWDRQGKDTMIETISILLNFMYVKKKLEAKHQFLKKSVDITSLW